MKVLLLLASLVATATLLGAGVENLPTLKVGSGVDSEVYSNVTVTSVTATHVFFTHSLGLGSAKLKDLEPDMQKHFHFDPVNAEAVQTRQAQANALYQQELKQKTSASRPAPADPTGTQAAPNDGSGARNLARSLLDRILAYHSGSPRNGRTVQVVYFYPCDREPPNDYQGRISRVMLNIQEFYRSEMIRNGFTENNEIPLQMSDGAVVIRTVKGKDAERSYCYSSGGRIYIEIKRALGKLNTTQNPTIIFDYLCWAMGDGEFCLHAPFYSKVGATAWVMDCDCLDPDFLKDTVHRVFYLDSHREAWEADNERFKKTEKTEKTIAEFNGISIGGAAHELGHAMQLPHDGQTAKQAEQLGLSLMGQGNWVHHREQWNPKQKGAFLSLADSLRLAATPLFTQSDRGRNLHGRITNMKLVFGSSAHALTVEGKVESNLEVLALIAYSAPKSRTNYNSYVATSWVGEVRDGVFSITVGEHKANVDDWQLELAFLFINGTVFTTFMPYHCSPSGTPDAEELNATWRVNEHGYSGNMSLEE